MAKKENDNKTQDLSNNCLEDLIRLNNNIGYNPTIRKALDDTGLLNKIGQDGLNQLLKNNVKSEALGENIEMTELFLEKGSEIDIRVLINAINSHSALHSDQAIYVKYLERNEGKTNFDILKNHLEKNVAKINQQLLECMIKHHDMCSKTIKILVNKGLEFSDKNLAKLVNIKSHYPSIKNDLVKFMLEQGVSTGKLVTNSINKDEIIKGYVNQARAVSNIFKTSSLAQVANVIKLAIGENPDLIIGRFNSIVNKLQEANDIKSLTKLRTTLITSELSKVSIEKQSIAEILFESSKILKEKYSSFENFSNTNKILSSTESAAIAKSDNNLVNTSSEDFEKQSLIKLTNALYANQADSKNSQLTDMEEESIAVGNNGKSDLFNQDSSVTESNHKCDLIAESSAIDNSAEI